MRVREETGASLVAVVRGEEVFTNPGPDLVLRAGDTVSVLGTADQRAAFLKLSRG
ncbi:MAG: cation:proton antiporter regulatory subunit [Rubrobacteraceae bacterium]